MTDILFSVIVPTYNRPHSLRACLESFCELEFPDGLWDLVVVNDGGEHSFDALDEALTSKLPIRFVDRSHAGPASARNAGARQALGEFLAFTDDDCRPIPTWLQAYQRCLWNSGWDGVGGSTRNPHPEQMPARAMQFFYNFLYQYLRMPNGDVYLLITNNAVYRRSVFLDAGGFDESFPFAAAEDRELSHRLIASGNRFGYCPEAEVWHDHKITWLGYLRLQLRYGRGDHYFRRALERRNMPRRIGQRRRPQFHMALARALAGAHAPPSMWLLLGLSQAVHWIGAGFEYWRARRTPKST